MLDKELWFKIVRLTLDKIGNFLSLENYPLMNHVLQNGEKMDGNVLRDRDYKDLMELQLTSGIEGKSSEEKCKVNDYSESSVYVSILQDEAQVITPVGARDRRQRYSGSAAGSRTTCDHLWLRREMCRTVGQPSPADRSRRPACRAYLADGRLFAFRP